MIWLVVIGAYLVLSLGFSIVVGKCIAYGMGTLA